MKLSNIETFTTAAFDTIPPDELAKLPASVLLKLQDEVQAEGEAARSHARMLGVVLSMRYGALEQAARSSAAKPTGRIRLEDNGIAVIANAVKKVDWNRDLLSAALSRMLPDIAERYGKWSVVVEERLFNEAPGVIKTVLEPARTVSVAPSNYRLEATTTEEDAA